MTSIALRASSPRHAVHVEQCMGTVFTIDIREPGDWTAAVAEVVSWLHYVDTTFSTYKPDSDISRIRRRELRIADAEPLVSEVLSLCASAQRSSRGYFTTRLGGQLDPTGLVKGWAVERASTILRDHGCAHHAINGGGDVQLLGEVSPGQPWVVGIADPHDRARVLTTVSGTDLAVATSGTAERGAHIVSPFTEQPLHVLASVTVIGPSLTKADAYATAAFAMGMSGLAWVETLEGYEALVVSAAGRLHWSSGWPARDVFTADRLIRMS